MVFEIFSFKEAAQQVLMYVCLSMCLWSTWKSTFLHHSTTSGIFQNVPEWSRMFQNVPEFSMHACRMFQNAWRMHAECMQIHELGLDLFKAVFFLRFGFQIEIFFSKNAQSNQLQIVDFKFFWRFGYRIFTDPVIRGCRQRFLVKYLQALFTEFDLFQVTAIFEYRSVAMKEKGTSKPATPSTSPSRQT